MQVETIANYCIVKEEFLDIAISPIAIIMPWLRIFIYIYVIKINLLIFNS